MNGYENFDDLEANLNDLGAGKFETAEVTTLGCKDDLEVLATGTSQYVRHTRQCAKA